MGKKEEALEKIYHGRMIKDFCLYTAQEVFEKHLELEEFVDPDIKWSLKYVAPYDRQGRTDSETSGADKPRVQVSAFFRKKLSLKDHHELYGINESLKEVEHRIHEWDSTWHDLWKERVKDFCELEKRFYPDGNPQKGGYKIADAYYEKANTVIEFQKSFDDNALEKSAFYKKENMRLMWVFYLPTLMVFKDGEKYKIREDNFYHFFRIEDIQPGFYNDNLIFLQDKNDRIYYIDHLERVESGSLLEATIRYFNCKKVFDNPDEFVKWLKYDWPNSQFFKIYGANDELKSLREIFLQFKGKEDKMFYLQNGTKNDIKGEKLIYCFIKDDGLIRTDNRGLLISYRCYTDFNGYYKVPKKWEPTVQNPDSKKWILLATNIKRYNDELEVGSK